MHVEGQSGKTVPHPLQGVDRKERLGKVYRPFNTVTKPFNLSPFSCLKQQLRLPPLERS